MVHFYDDGALAASVADHAAEGLEAGEAVVLIVEPAHLAATRCALRARGTDPDADAGPAGGIDRWPSGHRELLRDGARARTSTGAQREQLREQLRGTKTP